MPSGRMLMKKISFDEKISKLSLEATLLYTWCIPHLDCEGRIYGEPAILKGQIVPFVKELTIDKIEECIYEIVESDLAIIYGENIKYIQFNGFLKNQKINKDKESPSNIPSPEQLQSNSRVTPEQLQSNSATSKVNINKVKVNSIQSNLNKFNKKEDEISSLVDKFYKKFPNLYGVKGRIKAYDIFKERLKQYTIQEIENLIEWTNEVDTTIFNLFPKYKPSLDDYPDMNNAPPLIPEEATV